MKRIKRLTDIITNYCETVKPVIEQETEIKRVDNYEKFLNQMFLKRFYYCSLSLIPTLKSYQEDRNFKLPICLILRTALSDFLTYFYFVKIIIDNNGNIGSAKGVIYEYLADNLQFAMRDLRKNIYDNKEFEETEEIIKCLFPDFYDLETGNLIQSKSLFISHIVKELKSSEKLNWTIDAYDMYSAYSKYEHIGALTFEFQKNEAFSLDHEIKGIISSANYVLLAIERILIRFPEFRSIRDELLQIKENLKKLGSE
jgi:hypothetical protein